MEVSWDLSSEQSEDSVANESFWAPAYENLNVANHLVTQRYNVTQIPNSFKVGVLLCIG